MDSAQSDWRLTGRPLRYLLTTIVSECGPLTVAQLVDVVDREGFVLAGRPSKTISDSLRWEIEHGRVVRLGRATYGPGTMPRQTRAWIAQRVEALRSQSDAA